MGSGLLSDNRSLFSRNDRQTTENPSTEVGSGLIDVPSDSRSVDSGRVGSIATNATYGIERMNTLAGEEIEMPPVGDNIGSEIEGPYLAPSNGEQGGVMDSDLPTQEGVLAETGIPAKDASSIVKEITGKITNKSEEISAMYEEAREAAQKYCEELGKPHD